ncbi:MAG: phytoene/squalene synthase family protein [Verrucomicrobiales bacterium]
MTALGSSELTKDLLRQVSRSFYLSLRLLPGGMRECAGVAYLLARLSDTIADAGLIARDRRVAFLDDFCLLMRGENARRADWERGLCALAGTADLPEGEKRLLALASDCLRAYEGLPMAQREATREVIETITSGQRWDLTRFPDGETTVLREEGELRTYCYQVAGCVGEFWTKLAYGIGESFGQKEEAEIFEIARKYGESLQLINILRDVPEDLQRGRCYLPGLANLEKESLMEARQSWIAEARHGLASAESYAKLLRGPRLRMASVLPARLGVRTLDLLEKSDWAHWESGVKISRREVRRELCKALWG